MPNSMNQLVASNMAEITQPRTELMLIKQQRILEKMAFREIAKALLHLHQVLMEKEILNTSDHAIGDAVAIIQSCALTP